MNRARIKSYDREVKAAFKDAMRKAHDDAADVVLKKTKELCPKDTGDTAESYKKEVTKDGAYVGTNYFVGRLLETGTEKMPSQPHLDPAVEMSAAEIERIYERALS